MGRRPGYDRDTVLERAMRLFWRKGFNATSIHDLVAETGLNRGSLYAAFGDKQGLFLAAVDRYLATVGAERRALLDAPGSALAAIRRYLDDLVGFSLGDAKRLGCLLTNAAVELAPHDEVADRRLRAAFTGVEDAFYRALLRAQRQGELPAGADLRAGARFLLVLANGVRVLARANPDPALLHDAVRPALAVLENLNDRSEMPAVVLQPRSPAHVLDHAPDPAPESA